MITFSKTYCYFKTEAGLSSTFGRCMKRTMFTDAQIVAILKETDNKMLVKNICRTCWIRHATYYKGKAKLRSPFYCVSLFAIIKVSKNCNNYNAFKINRLNIQVLFFDMNQTLLLYENYADIDN